MQIKSLIPNTAVGFYRKINWFVRNYRDVGFDKALVPYDKTIDGKITYATDGLVTTNNADFINEPRFARAYAEAAETNPWPGFTLQWRVYIVCWFADLVKNLEGDFVECGVNTGAYARAVVEYINFKTLNKKFFLFDTFGGLVENLVSEKEKAAGIDKYFGVYKDVFEQVKETFKEFNVEVVKGMVPDTLPACQSEKIAYLSIDMNCVEPEIQAAEYFWDKIVTGGVMILDDYGFPMHINQKLAFDEFAKRKNVQILSLPTGQGVVIKK